MSEGSLSQEYGSEEEYQTTKSKSKASKGQVNGSKHTPTGIIQNGKVNGEVKGKKGKNQKEGNKGANGAPEGKQQDQQIFVEHLPVIGKVPIVFYIPDSGNQGELIELIHKHGGMVVDQHECFTYQVKMDGQRMSNDQFYKGMIYSDRWIYESIKSKKLMQSDSYFICMNLNEKRRKLNLSKKKKLTIIEGIKIFEIMSSTKQTLINRPNFWEKFAQKDILPERNAAQLEAFWKSNQSKTLEDYLIRSIHEKTDYCLSFKQIPNPEFLKMFKSKFENEFKLLKQDQDSSENSDMEDEEKKVDDRIMKSFDRFQQLSTIQDEKRQENSAKAKELIGKSFSSTLEPRPSADQKTHSNRRTSKKSHEEAKKESHKDKELNTPSPKKGFSFKPVDRFESPVKTYNIFDFCEQIYTQESRPETTVENVLEAQLSKRMKKFLPTNLDLVDYDRELLNKQLDLETVEITLTSDPAKAKEYEIPQFYRRTVQRFPNQEGMFKRLQLDLQRIAQEYGVDDEELHAMFIEVSCSKSKLIDVLKGQSYQKWSELEDIALRKGQGCPEYTYLLRTKGHEEIIRRKKFLGI